MGKRKPRIGDSRRALADERTRRTIADDQDMQALVVTVGLAAQLTQAQATTAEWDALVDALVAEHTPAQLARMLTGAAALIVKVGAE